MKRALTLLVLATAVRTASAGGSGTIEGTVVNQSGAVLASGVRLTITCNGVPHAAALDGNGHFSVAGLPEGTCTVTGTGAGFASITFAVTVGAGSIATILVQMAPPRPPMPPAPPMAAGAGVEPAPMPKEVERPMRAPARKPMAGSPAIAAKPMPPPPPPKPVLPPMQKEQNELVRRDGKIVLQKAKLRALDGDKADMPAIGGWAPVRVFPVPQYAKGYDGPRTDFRETIYWNPSVETDASGNADVAFVTSDAVTSFRADAEGFSATGTPGAGSVAIQSKLPVVLDVRLPLEVSSGDTIQLPVTVANNTSEPLDAALTANFGVAFKLGKSPAGSLRVAANSKQTIIFPLDVVAIDGNADVALAVASRGLKDELKKTIRVVPKGFPFEVAVSGTSSQERASRHTIDLAGALPGSIRANITMYPSPVAAMTQGMAGMIREPGGCFEQTSSTNYPNVMILGYLGANDAADPQLVAKTQSTLDRGYKILAGYETPEKGYEWFGNNPGHEALTAYGLMEFADMAKVYDVDAKMVQRTADWLMSRRNGKGGFQRSAQALDTFGRASEPTTNAYILWALAEAKRTAGLDTELSAIRTLGRDTRDPYLLALVANTELLVAPKAGDAYAKRLAALQAKDGSFPGAKETITMSGGDSLVIETTALAALALIKASPNNEYEPQIRSAADWLNTKRGGYGQWGNTQATILGLKALSAYATHARQMAAPGSATLVVNGKSAGTIAFDKGRREALVWDDVASLLAPGVNTIEIKLASAATLPYTVTVEYRAARPQSSAKSKVALTTRIDKTSVAMGEGVTIQANVANTSKDGIPMTLARIGIPGGLVAQTWQLKELRDKHLIDFYETRPREVIVYWRALPPSATKEVQLKLLAAVPGTYEAPASSAYLYYTAEDKAWTPPLATTVTR